MLDMKLSADALTAKDVAKEKKLSQAPTWETPKLEDVSEQVMAQPYIRFT